MKPGMPFQFKFVPFLLLIFAVNAFAQPPRASTPPPRRETLLNGLRVALWNVPSASKVTLKLRIHAGAAFDLKGREGMTVLLSEVLFPTSESRAYFTEDLGGSFELKSTYDYIEFDFSSDAANYLSMIDSVANAFTSPNFDKEVIETVKARIAATRADLAAQPNFAADSAAAERLFGDFPYGRPILGTAESMAQIDFVDLGREFRRLFSADNASLTLTGNIKSDLALRGIRRYFGAWPKADARAPYTFKQPEVPPTALYRIDSPKTGIAEIRFASRGFARGGDDFIASEILASILEERMKANTPAEHRESVFVRNDAFVLPGAFVYGIRGIENDPNSSENSSPKIEANDIMAKSFADKITNEEFQRAKLTIERKLSRVEIDSRWLDAETYKLASIDSDARALSTVTVADVQKALDKLASQPIVSILVHTPREN